MNCPSSSRQHCSPKGNLQLTRGGPDKHHETRVELGVGAALRLAERRRVAANQETRGAMEKDQVAGGTG